MSLELDTGNEGVRVVMVFRVTSKFGEGKPGICHVVGPCR